MTRHQKHVIEYFDQTHNDYRRLWGIDRHLGLHCGFFDNGRRGHDAAVLHMNCALASWAGITTADHVLDAGCGVGGSAIWLARHLGARVTGINIHPRQVELARHYARQHGVQDRVCFQLVDFAATELPAASFDVVWALESMCYAEDKDAFLREAFRLLKPGGRLVIADGFLTHDQFTWEGRQIVERWRRGWAIPSVLSVSHFRQMLEQTGFQKIRFRDVTTQVTPSSQRIYRATLLFYPLGLLLHWLGLRTDVQTRGIASGYYQYHARRRGLAIYAFLYAKK